jgi:hypothetical protein
MPLVQGIACTTHRPKLLRIFRGALHPGCPGSGPRRRVFQFIVPAMKPAMNSSHPSSLIDSGSAWRWAGRGCGTGVPAGAASGFGRMPQGSIRGSAPGGDVETVSTFGLAYSASRVAAIWPGTSSSGGSTGCGSGGAGAFSCSRGTRDRGRRLSALHGLLRRLPAGPRPSLDHARHQ